MRCNCIYMQSEATLRHRQIHHVLPSDSAVPECKGIVSEHEWHADMPHEEEHLLHHHHMSMMPSHLLRLDTSLICWTYHAQFAEHKTIYTLNIPIRRYHILSGEKKLRSVQAAPTSYAPCRASHDAYCELHVSSTSIACGLACWGGGGMGCATSGIAGGNGSLGGGGGGRSRTCNKHAYVYIYMWHVID